MILPNCDPIISLYPDESIDFDKILHNTLAEFDFPPGVTYEIENDKIILYSPNRRVGNFIISPVNENLIAKLEETISNALGR